MRAGNAGSTGPVIRCRHGRAARWRGSVKTECFVARQTTICSFSLVIRIARLPGNSSSSRGLDGLAKACGDVIRGLPACCGLSRGGNGKSGVCGSMLPVHPVLMVSAAAGLPVEVLLQPALPVVQHGRRHPYCRAGRVSGRSGLPWMVRPDRYCRHLRPGAAEPSCFPSGACRGWTAPPGFTAQRVGDWGRLAHGLPDGAAMAMMQGCLPVLTDESR